MMAGFRDILAWTLRWYSAPVLSISGPGGQIQRAMVYTPGAVHGKVFTPGAVHGKVFTPGAAEVEILSS